MKSQILKSLIPLLLSTACVQSVWVHEKDSSNTSICKAKRLKGIPFRTKTTIFEHVSRYDKRWKKVTLQKKTRVLYTDKNGAQKVLESADPARTRRTPAGTAELNALRNLVVGSATEGAITKAFQSLPTVDIDRIRERLVDNDLRREDVVDYEREFYLNSPLPWFGTSSFKTKLAKDGTLTDAETSAETKLAEGISTLLPIKEVLTAAATQATDLGAMSNAMTLLQTADVSAANIDDSQTIVFDLTIEEEGLVWEFRGLSDSFPSDGIIAAIPFEPDSRPHVLKPLPTEPAATSAKKDSGKKISISGEIALPRSPIPAP